MRALLQAVYGNFTLFNGSIRSAMKFNGGEKVTALLKRCRERLRKASIWRDRAAHGDAISGEDQRREIASIDELARRVTKLQAASPAEAIRRVLRRSVPSFLLSQRFNRIHAFAAIDGTILLSHAPSSRWRLN